MALHLLVFVALVIILFVAGKQRPQVGRFGYVLIFDFHRLMFNPDVGSIYTLVFFVW